MNASEELKMENGERQDAKASVTKIIGSLYTSSVNSIAITTSIFTLVLIVIIVGVMGLLADLNLEIRWWDYVSNAFIFIPFCYLGFYSISNILTAFMYKKEQPSSDFTPIYILMLLFVALAGVIVGETLKLNTYTATNTPLILGSLFFLFIYFLSVLTHLKAERYVGSFYASQQKAAKRQEQLNSNLKEGGDG